MRIAYCKCSVVIAPILPGPNGGWMVKDFREGGTCDQCLETIVVVDGDPSTLHTEEDKTMLFQRMFVIPDESLQNWTQN